MFLLQASVNLGRAAELQSTSPPPSMFPQFFCFADTPKDAF